MRVRSNINPLAGREPCRSEMIEEDKRADRFELGGGQQAAHRKTAQVFFLRNKQKEDWRTWTSLAGTGIGLIKKIAHEDSSAVVLYQKLWLKGW
jgi:hypothetical protein